MAALSFFFIRHLVLLFFQYFNTDELLFLHGIWSVVHGVWPYRDFLELHPPLYYFAYLPGLAAPEGAPAVFATRMISFIFFLLINLLIYRIVQRSAKGRGRLPGLFSLMVFNAAFICGSKWIEIRPSIPGALFFLLGLLYYLKWLEEPKSRPLPLLRIGLFLFLSTMAGWTFLAPVAGIYLHLVFFALRRSDRFGVFVFLPAAAPMVLGWGFLLILYFHYATPFEGFGHYTALSYHSDWVPEAIRKQAKSLTLRWTLEGDLIAWMVAAVCWVICLKKAPAVPGFLPLVFPTVLMALSLLISPFFFLQQVSVLFLLLAIPAGWALEFRFSRALMVLTALVGILSTGLVFVHRSVFNSNSDQVASLNFVMKHTQPGDLILDGWSGYGTFRPHAGPVFWFPCTMINQEAKEKAYGYHALKALEQHRFGAVIYDKQLKCFGEPLKTFIERDYEPAERFKPIYLPRAQQPQ